MRIIVLFTIFAVAACSGNLYTAKNGAENEREAGVYVYPPAAFVDIYEKTTFVTKEGVLLASKAGVDMNGEKIKCVPETFQKFVIRPDYQNPSRIFYSPGILEENTFGVELEQGMLKSVNTTSKPDRGQTLKAVSDTVPNFMPLAQAMNILSEPSTKSLVFGEPEKPKIQCNSTPQFVETKYAPKASGTYTYQ